MKMLAGIGRAEFPGLLVSRGYTLGVEIGVQAGDHAVHILNHWIGSLILVDPWKNYDGLKYNDMANVEDEAHKIHMKRCKAQLVAYTGRFTIMRMFSHEAAQKIEDGAIDFVYLDGNHTYKYVKLDLESWWPKIHIGGMMSGHDFTVDAPPREGNVYGVKPAVLDFCQIMGIEELHVSNEEWPTWYVFKNN